MAGITMLRTNLKWRHFRRIVERVEEAGRWKGRGAVVIGRSHNVGLPIQVRHMAHSILLCT